MWACHEIKLRVLKIMAETQYLRGACEKCKENIEFPIHGWGQTINCPHCGQTTELLTDQESFSKLKLWNFYAVCDQCGCRRSLRDSPERLDFFRCPNCNIDVPYKEGLLPQDLEDTSPCPKCGKPKKDTQNICQHCHARFIPTICPRCGCEDLNVITPSKPALFAPLSFSGIVLSAVAGAAADAIFQDEYYCADCGQRCD